MAAERTSEDHISSPLFILGYSRSGTSLLWNMLNKSDAIALQWENDVVYGLLARGFELEATADPNDIVGKIASLRELRNTTARFLDRLGPLDEHFAESVGLEPPRTLKQAVEYLLQKRQNTRYWGDKSLTSALAIRPISRTWPAARFIHIVRDPRDIACSQFEKKHGMEPSTVKGLAARFRLLRDFHRHAQRWQYWNHCIVRYIEEIDDANVLTVRYEDLVAEPLATMQKICGFLEIDYDEAMIEPGSDATTVTAQRWHRNIARPVSAAKVGRYEKIGKVVIGCVELSAPLMKRFGYMSEPHPALDIRLGLTIVRLPVVVFGWMQRPKFSKCFS